MCYSSAIILMFANSVGNMHHCFQGVFFPSQLLVQGSPFLPASHFLHPLDMRCFLNQSTRTRTRTRARAHAHARARTRTRARAHTRTHARALLKRIYIYRQTAYLIRCLANDADVCRHTFCTPCFHPNSSPIIVFQQCCAQAGCFLLCCANDLSDTPRVMVLITLLPTSCCLPFPPFLSNL